jgi:preprotein translocase subunit SecB
MIEAEKAAFNFVKFSVNSFSYNKSKKEQGKQLKLRFNPSGKYYPNEGKFDLYIDFTGEEEGNKKKPVIKMVCIAEFKFPLNLTLEDIQPYFYANSIAIVFPYLRAFISTLTLQANSGVIMLGLVNFTNMSQPLKDNTEIVY